MSARLDTTKGSHAANDLPREPSKRRRVVDEGGPADDLSLRSAHWQDESVVAASARLSAASCAQSKERDDKLRFRRQRMHSHYKDLEQA
jgi:hypothetical protein